MIRFITPLFLTLVLSACSESFNSLDVSDFNREIEERTDIDSAEELIKVYYAYSDRENKQNITISTVTLEDGSTAITLIHDKLEDDSQKATKIVMTAKQTNKQWTVIEIKTNRKCWKGRGHTRWGKGLCE